MSLRDRIRRTLPVILLGSRSADRITDEITAILEEEISRSASVHRDGARQYADVLSGIDQGITRLALIAFLAGVDSTDWNGTGSHQWVRYRGHHIDRDMTDDGHIFRLVFTGSDKETHSTILTRSSRDDAIVASLLVAGNIDDIIDAVIDSWGVPGDEIPDAEVVELVDGATARRVIQSWWAWNKRNTEDVQNYDPATAVDRFAIAINAGEVTP